MGFKLEKNGPAFNISKGIEKILVGVGWDAGATQIDLDAHALSCVVNNGRPKLYSDGSHALGYFNDVLKQSNGSFQTADGSMTHSGDDRTGENSQGGDDEVIKIDLAKLPANIKDVQIWVTIHEALQRNQNFGKVNSCYVRVIDESNGTELARYDLGREFDSAVSAQIGSLIRADNGTFSFAILGAGLNDKSLGDILGALS